MRTSQLIENRHRRSLTESSEQGIFDGYEQRLNRWGCTKCNLFEKRVFKSGLPSDEELDAYIICRFAAEPVDLIGEATACPKDCTPPLHDNQSRSGRRGRLYCVYEG
jgi:hypothetical protein